METEPAIAPATAYLNVERSFSGRLWVSRPVDQRMALALAQGLSLPEVVGRVLAARGITPESADDFLLPRLRALLPDPSRFRHMDRAARRIADAVMAGEGIAVFGDYDVDGATSSALLARFFRAVGAGARVYIPDRITEGYGPNAPALERLRQDGARLVITVDCGTTAFEPLAAGTAAGLDIVVVDHHTAEPRLPEAVAVVNPNRLDEDGRYGNLAAVGVTFLLVIAVNRVLRADGWYAGRPEPDLMRWLDLVALGTICDVVPLTGLNRALVSQGLKVMAGRGNPGIAALADVARLSERPDGYHAGYVLGPRVNAGGRIGAADLGTRLLSTDDPSEAMTIARQLDACNAERRSVEAAVLEEARARVDAATGPDDGLVFAVGDGWHPGVIGIVASRLMERYNRPACVIALENGIGKASGRSVKTVDLGAAVIAARQAGLLMNGGGHRMAAGFTVAEDRLPELRRFLSERIIAQRDGPPLTPTLELDGALAVGGATVELAQTVHRLGPFGAGNAEPRFAIMDARIVRADVVGANHVRCILTGPAGGRLKAIAFRALESDLGQALLKHTGTPVHLAGHLRIDRWGGNEDVQLFISDAAPAGGRA